MIRTQEINQLDEIANSQTHAAYAGFVHGLSSRWTYLQKTIPNIHNLLQLFQDAIHQTWIYSHTHRLFILLETHQKTASPSKVQYWQLIGIPRPISSYCFYKDICPSLTYTLTYCSCQYCTYMARGIGVESSLRMAHVSSEFEFCVSQ